MKKEVINATEFVRVVSKMNEKIVAPEYEVLRHANNVSVSDVSFDEIVQYFIKHYEKNNEHKLDKNKLKIISISKYKKVETQLFESECA